MNTQAQVWAKRLERQRDTDLTDAEYANELGIEPASLAIWRRKLRAGFTAHAASTTVRSDTPPRRCKNPRCGAVFVPVRDSHEYCTRRCQRRACFLRWERRLREGSE